MNKSNDIFEFWSKIKRGDNIHPYDREAFKRINTKQHGFNLECLPAPYTGKLKTAPIVLLYLSPGLDKDLRDINEAKSEEGKDYYYRRWQGNEPLPNENFSGHEWYKKHTKRFGSYETIKDHIAILEIGAYHSYKVDCYASLLALPSSRAMLDWAQNVLFPDAEEGKRFVICMRSAAYWGLETGKKYGKMLYSPEVNRAGYPINNSDNLVMIEHAKEFLKSSKNF